MKNKYMYLAGIFVLLSFSLIALSLRDNVKLPERIDEAPKPLYSITGDSNKPLFHPLSTAVAPSGRVYVSDSGNNCVQVFRPNGKFLFTFGEEGKNQGQLSAPYGIVVLPEGSVLVSDMQNKRIQQFNQDGKFEKVFLDSAQGIKPGILLWDNEKLYVSDLANHQVVVMNEKGEILNRFRDAMNFPQGLAVLQDKLLVSDAGNQVIRVLGASAEGNRAINGTEEGKKAFNLLRGLAVDNLSRIVVVDSMASEVRFLTQEGKYLFSIGSPGKDMNSLQYPAGVTIDKRGRIYFADWENNRIQVWGYTK